MPVSVLIVDDHPTFRSFARRVLERAGYAVVGEAHDGATAIAATRELRPEAVLLDVLLPDTSGLAVALELARVPHGPAVILTSSRAASDFGVALDETPSLGFLPKASFSGPAFAELLGRS